MASTQEAGALYFPPPPTSADSNERQKTGRHSKKFFKSEASTTKVPAALRPPRRSSLRHQIGYPTPARKRRLRSAQLGSIDISPRHYVLIGLLLLSFLVLVLGFIFADCVALPHTVDGADQPNNGTLPAEKTIHYTRADLTGASSPPTAAGNDFTGTANSATSTTDNTTSSDQYLADESKRLGFDSPKNLAILFFYTATLPLLTIMHTVIEMIVLWYTKRKAATSRATYDETSDDSDTESITKMRPLSLAKKHNLHFNHKTRGRLGAVLPYLPATSLGVSILLTCGWIIINSIQAHCEIPLPSRIKSAGHSPASISSQALCPVQIRGHFMHGIHELSIVKNVFGWIVVVVYAGYVVWCARVNGLIWTAAKEQRRARKLQEDIEGKREEQLRQSIVRFAIRTGTPGDDMADRHNVSAVSTVSEKKSKLSAAVVMEV